MLAFLSEGLDSEFTVTFHTRLFTYSMGRRIKRLLTPILQTKGDKVSRGPLQTSACKSKPMVWHLQIKEGLLSVGCIGDRGAPDMLRDITQVKQYVLTCQLSQYTDKKPGQVQNCTLELISNSTFMVCPTIACTMTTIGMLHSRHHCTSWLAIITCGRQV